MATIREIARAARVSTATVSRVFNDRPHVSERIRERVLVAARDLRYTPQQTACRERIALVLPAPDVLPTRPFQSFLTAMAIKHLIRRRVGFEVLGPGDGPATSSFLVHGVLCTSAACSTCELVDRMRDLPMVCLNGAGSFPGHTVNADHAQGMGLAIDHLAGHGHRRIGVLLRDAEDPVTQARLAGFQAQAHRVGLPADDELVRVQNGDGALDPVRDLVRAGATALVLGAEDLGPAGGHALRTLDRRVPEDLSLISWELPGVSGLLAPPHTTVAQDAEAMAGLAVDMLLGLLGGDTPPARHLVVPCFLQERASVRALTGARR